MSKFYCKKVCGDPDFSIEEWNEALDYCNRMELSEEESNRILHPDMFPCEKQCFDCIATVGKRRLETQNLLNKNK